MHVHLRLSLALLAAPSLAAQVPISGSIYDGSGGPLLSGTVYHATSHLTVPAGQTLTVQAGAIVKLGGRIITLDGRLNCNGTSSSPVIFTSIHDDAAGGDTNGNGAASVPSRTDWYGLVFNDGSDASVLTYTTIRYTGAGFYASATVNSADITLSDCVITDGYGGGINSDAASRPTVARCSFQRLESSPAIYGLSMEAVPGYTTNTVASCPGGNYMRVRAATISSNVTINATNCLGGALVLDNHLTVAAGTTLRLNAAVVLKALTARIITLNGRLLCNGTVANPVVFTSFHDDTAGGDTNGNLAATAPTRTDWYGVVFNDGSDASVLTHTKVRYTGAGFYANVDLTSADVTLADCEFTDGYGGGINQDAASRPSVMRCSFQRIESSPAVRGAPLEAVPGYVDNTVSNCPGGNYLRVRGGSIVADTTILATNCLGGALVYDNHCTVAAGVTLTLGVGVVLKPVNARIFTVNGTLLCNGTAGSPVGFTSYADDALGGDTNGNGAATLPTRADWYGLVFNDGSDQSVLTHTIVRYTGSGFYPNLDLYSANITADHCTITDGYGGGIRIDSPSRPTVQRCSFARIESSPAIYGGTLEAVRGFAYNSVASCPGGNFHRVDDTTVTGAAVISGQNCLGGALVYASHLTVNQGASLTLNYGVVLKASTARIVNVHGAMHTNGPVVFTSIKDDVYGGDTNGDGAGTQPAATDWYGITFLSTASGVVDRAIVRYSGSGFYAGINCASAQVSLRGCRVEFGYGDGFDLGAAAAAQDLVAFANRQDGIRLRTGAFSLLRATAAYNYRNGVLRMPAWTGIVRSTIGYGNAMTGFAGFTGGEINFSDGPGIIGGAGNRNVDPLFVNVGAGDLRLQPGSPCIDRGQPADQPSGVDPFGFPRYLDGNLDGTQVVDMGAYEFDNILLAIGGTPTPGGSLAVNSFATPGIVAAALMVGINTPVGSPLLNLGALYLDLAGPVATLPWVPTGATAMPVPANLTPPLAVGFQLVGLGAVFPSGNTSNPVVVVIN